MGRVGGAAGGEAIVGAEAAKQRGKGGDGQPCLDFPRHHIGPVQQRRSFGRLLGRLLSRPRRDRRGRIEGSQGGGPTGRRRRCGRCGRSSGCGSGRSGGSGRGRRHFEHIDEDAEERLCHAPTVLGVSAQVIKRRRLAVRGRPVGGVEGPQAALDHPLDEALAADGAARVAVRSETVEHYTRSVARHQHQKPLPQRPHGQRSRASLDAACCSSCGDGLAGCLGGASCLGGAGRSTGAGCLGDAGCLGGAGRTGGGRGRSGRATRSHRLLVGRLLLRPRRLTSEPTPRSPPAARLVVHR